MRKLYNTCTKTSPTYKKLLVREINVKKSFVYSRFLSIFLRQGFFKSHYRWHDAIGLLLPVWMGLASGAPIPYVLSTWLWINCTGSFIFYSIGVNAAHHHPDAIKDGDEPA